jgi:hypothetical protein
VTHPVEHPAARLQAGKMLHRLSPLPEGRVQSVAA